MSVDFTCDEKDRFSSRLATIPGIRPLRRSATGSSWRSSSPRRSLARSTAVSPGIMSVPRGMEGAVRVHVGDPKVNEQVIQTLRDLVA